jgi:hypothetical protein
VVLAREGSHAQASQFIDGRRGLLWISRGVSGHELEGPSGDPAGVIDVAKGELEPSEQVLTCLDPSRPSERNENTDLDG